MNVAITEHGHRINSGIMKYVPVMTLLSVFAMTTGIMLYRARSNVYKKQEDTPDGDKNIVPKAAQVNRTLHAKTDEHIELPVKNTQVAHNKVSLKNVGNASQNTFIDTQNIQTATTHKEHAIVALNALQTDIQDVTQTQQQEGADVATVVVHTLESQKDVRDHIGQKEHTEDIRNFVQYYKSLFGSKQNSLRFPKPQDIRTVDV